MRACRVSTVAGHGQGHGQGMKEFMGRHLQQNGLRIGDRPRARLRMPFLRIDNRARAPLLPLLDTVSVEWPRNGSLLPNACPFARPWERCDLDERNARQSPGLDANKLLANLKGRQMLFIGDSVQVQFFVSLVCELYRQSPGALRRSTIQFKRQASLRKRCGSANMGRCHYDTACAWFDPSVRICSCFITNIFAGRPAVPAVRHCMGTLQLHDVVVYGVCVYHSTPALFSDILTPYYSHHLDRCCWRRLYRRALSRAEREAPERLQQRRRCQA